MRFLFGNYSHKKDDDKIEEEFDVISPEKLEKEENDDKTHSLKNSPSRTIPPLEIVVDEPSEETPLLSNNEYSPKINYDTLPLMSPRRINHIVTTSFSKSFSVCKSLFVEKKEARLADLCKELLVDENLEMRSYEVLSPCKSKPIIITFFYDTFCGIKWRINGIKIFNHWFSKDFFQKKNFRIECINVKINENNPEVLNTMKEAEEMRKEEQLPITPHDGLLFFTKENQKMKWEPFDLYLFYYVIKQIRAL